MKDVSCIFPSLERCELKVIYRTRKCTMNGGFCCNMLGELQLLLFRFLFSSYVIVRNVLFVYLILFSIVWMEFGWVLF